MRIAALYDIHGNLPALEAVLRDPLLWPESTNLFEDDAYGPAIELLDEFLAADGAWLIDDPLKRAMLQRDLWAVFDWLGLAAASAGPGATHLTYRVLRNG